LRQSHAPNFRPIIKEKEQSFYAFSEKYNLSELLILRFSRGRQAMDSPYRFRRSPLTTTVFGKPTALSAETLLFRARQA
jgi:hypothetical protein